MTEFSSTEGVFVHARRSRRESGPRVARALVALIVSSLVFAAIWASNTPLKEITRADGEIGPAGELRRVDHFDGGEIVEIFVSVGSRVAAGEPLARVEHPDIAPQIEEFEAELKILDDDIANARWLLGEAKGHIPSPSAAARRNYHISQQQTLRSRINQLQQAAIVATRLTSNARRRIELSEQSLSRLEALRARGVVSEAQYIIQAEETAGIRDEMIQAEANQMRSMIEVREAIAAREEARLTFREEQLQSLNVWERDRRVLNIKLNDLRERAKRQLIRAPEAGVIQSVGITTIGEVVPPGALLFELLPSDEKLVAVIKLKPADIGFVEVGAQVVLKPTGLDAKRYGEVRGVISVISPTSVAPEREDPFFRATVELSSQRTENGRQSKALRSGMILQAEIQTSERTVAEYILKPIDSFFGEALTER